MTQFAMKFHAISLTAAATFALIAGSLSCDAAEVVRYSDFGAKGDGKTDDFDALVKAHEHANEKGLPVVADDGATYYIGGAAKTAVIMTDTHFGEAKFIIDDTELEDARKQVFEVRSDQKPIRIRDIETLEKGQERISTPLPGPCLVTVINNDKMQFIRRGNNQNKGKAQRDSFLVNRRGEVDPNTPIIWDFKNITKMEALPLDETPLIVKGGKFTTIAPSKVSTAYHARGISITRSNVVVEGMEHRITGEGKDGPPYRGFIGISECANVQIRDSIFSGHKTYHKIGNAGKRVAMGSYDLSLNGALNVALINCTQFNDINDRTYWGIMGTNFCKNILLDGCKLSRFDAHMGVTNATIKNSTLGYMGIRLTGFGTFTAENTTVKARSFISLRSDYGSTWNGEVIIRDCKLEGGSTLIDGSNDGQHDFGYTTYLPRRVVIDGFHFTGKQAPVVFSNINPRLKNASYKMAHPQVITEQVAYRNVKADSGKALRLSDNKFMFRDVKVHEGK